MVKSEFCEDGATARGAHDHPWFCAWAANDCSPRLHSEVFSADSMSISKPSQAYFNADVIESVASPSQGDIGSVCFDIALELTFWFC